MVKTMHKHNSLGCWWRWKSWLHICWPNKSIHDESRNNLLGTTFFGHCNFSLQFLLKRYTFLFHWSEMGRTQQQQSGMLLTVFCVESRAVQMCKAQLLGRIGEEIGLLLYSVLDQGESSYFAKVVSTKRIGGSCRVVHSTKMPCLLLLLALAARLTLKLGCTRFTIHLGKFSCILYHYFHLSKSKSIYLLTIWERVSICNPDV